MRKMKKPLALLLSIVLCVSLLAVPAVAARDTSFETTLAQDLKDLGLFKGVSDTDFDLNRAPNRVEALVMLIRLLGKENEAQNGYWWHPFTDVPNWARNYVGYAYQNGLTNGIGNNKFGSNDLTPANTYLTFVLRALGYTDENNADFTWKNPYDLARNVGILPDCVDQNTFWRADAVTVSYAALNVPMKNTTTTLAKKLMGAGVFTQSQFNAVYDPSAISNYLSTGGAMNAEQIYSKCSPAVFYIEVYDASGRALASGSGFFIASDGTAVTNYHVIEGASSAKITLSTTGKVYNVEGVYDYDVNEDWAVIKVQGNGFNYLPIGSTATVTGGATVFAIGSPQGFQNTISQGIISNPNRLLDGVNYIQITASISSGSSGGALINKFGQVIGITSATWSEGQNLNFAIPMTYVQGYTRGTLKSIASVSGVGNNPGPSNPGGNTPNQAGAYDALRSWVRSNYNTTMDGDRAFTFSFYEDGIDFEFMIVDDTSNNELAVFLYTGYINDYYELVENITLFGLTRSGQEYLGLFASYYDDVELCTGFSYINAPYFHEDGTTTFFDYDGPNSSDLKRACQNLAHTMYVLSVDFVEMIFEEYLYSTGYNMADFGFTKMYRTANPLSNSFMDAGALPQAIANLDAARFDLAA